MTFLLANLIRLTSLVSPGFSMKSSWAISRTVELFWGIKDKLRKATEL